MKFAQRIAGNRPILLSGDFNAEPIEPVYSTIINYNPLGLSSAYADLLASLTHTNDANTPRTADNVPNGDSGESDDKTNGAQNLLEYLISNEPPFTTWKIREDGEVCHTIDYIFYSHDKLKVKHLHFSNFLID